MKRLIIIFGLLLMASSASATITYDAGNNIITVTGYTEDTPCTFTDIYNADQSGGWGVVSKQGDTQFLFDTEIDAGDGSTSTYLHDTNKQVTFSDTSNSYGIKVATNAKVWFGELVDSTLKTTKDGCHFIFLRTGSYHSMHCTTYDANTYLHLFGCLIYQTYGKIQTSGKTYNCILMNRNIMVDSSNSDTYNLQVQSADCGLESSKGTFEKLTFTDCDYGIYVYNSVFVYDIKNATLYNCTNELLIRDMAVDWSLINVDSNKAWSIKWNTDYPSTGRVLRKYEGNLKVIEMHNGAINGAIVKIWDKDSNLVVDTTTDANGVIPTQIITRGYYNQANGSTLQDASPHTMTVEKDGYTTYEAEFTLKQKTDWLIALQKSCSICPSLPSQASLFPNLDIIDQKCKTMPILIYTGFNYISIPLYQYNTSLYALFGDHPVNNDTVKKYVNGAWSISTYNNGTWNNASNIEPIKPFCGYEYDRAGDNFTLNVSGYIKSNIITFDEKTYVGTNIIRPIRSDKDD